MLLNAPPPHAASADTASARAGGKWVYIVRESWLCRGFDQSDVPSDTVFRVTPLVSSAPDQGLVSVR